MEPPGEHAMHKVAEKRRGLFRKKSKRPAAGSTNTSTNNTNNGTGSSSNDSSPRRREQQQQQLQQPARTTASDSDEDYVHVVRTNTDSSIPYLSSTPTTSVHLPPAVLRQQQQQHLQQQGWASQSITSNASVATVATCSSRTSQVNAANPHHHQRKSLHKKKASLSQYQMTAISKHYAVSRQILSAFDSHWSNRLWVTAYAVGLQFVETALLEIPKHGYFYSDRHERERMESSLEAARVAHLLQELLETQQQDQLQQQQHGSGDDDQDNEPTAGLVPSGDLQHVQKLLALALEQIEQASTDQDLSAAQKHKQAVQFQLARAEVEDDLRYDEKDACNATTTVGDWIAVGCEPLLACAESFMGAGGSVVVPADYDSVSSAAVAPASPNAKSVLSATYSIMSMGNSKANSTVASPVKTRNTTSLASFATPLPSSIRNEQRSSSLSGVKLNSPTGGLSHSIALQEERLRSFSGRVPPPMDVPERSVAALHFQPSWQRNDDSSSSLRNSYQQQQQPPPLTHHRSSASVSSTQTTEELLLEKALFLSGLEVFAANDVGEYDDGQNDAERGGAVPSGEFDVSYHARAKAPSAAVLELSTLARFYHEDFDSLQKSGRVRISLADTFQGRLPESTNGCTVIAPLLCIHHLVAEQDGYYNETGGDPGLADSLIELVIDRETPVVLKQLRRQLGLAEHAFLIPADAHDYLQENGQLAPDQFQTVTGGNILHDDHLNAFVAYLEEAKDRKVAATLFFHEHVVAILKLKRVDHAGNVSWWYDFIDSLPLKETLRRSDESPQDLCERLGLLTNLTDADIAGEEDMVALPKTARIRCLNAEALTAVIRWYACSKFNEENIAFIDQYPWDDAACDFDPRVFQAFVWSGGAFDNSGHAAVRRFSS